MLFVFVEQLDATVGGDAQAGARRYTAVMEGVVERLKAKCGILAVTPTDAIPFSVVTGTGGPDVHYGLDGQSYTEGLRSPTAGYNAASDDYFSALRIPLLRLRVFTVSDNASAQRVAIVSEGFAKHVWPGRDPLGQQVRFLNNGAVGVKRTVVGIVADTRYHDLLVIRFEVYTPIRQSGTGSFIAVRTVGEPLAALPLVRDALHELDQGYGIAKAVSGQDLLDTKLARPRFLAAIVFALALTAAALAAVGLYGVLSFNIGQWKHEFGIRLALGATGAQVRALVLRDVVRLASIGVTVGLAIGIPAAGILRHEIAGVNIFDPLTFLAVILILLAMIVAASVLPITRASRVDPAVALRNN